jgi:hypothetical protein
MRTKFRFIIGLIASIYSFCQLAYSEENNFIQPCSDSGGYYGWLGGPNKDHLGHDYNAPAGTKVKAISDGTVWNTYTNISGFGSEGKPGPAIWIKHRVANGKYFYALYGHIKPGSDILKGAEVKAGQIIGTVIEYRDKISKEDISHLHLGIWNSESDPPLSKMGYGAVRQFTDPVKFLRENKPYIKQASADKSKILFLGGLWTTGLGTLFAINPDASGKTEVLPKIFSKYKGDGCLNHLSVSADGRKIAFPIYPNIGNHFAEGMAIIDIDKGMQRKLYSHPPLPSLDAESIAMLKIKGGGGMIMRHLRWSPEGKRIAFEGVRGGGSTSVYVVNVDVGGPLNHINGYSSHFPTWVSDGKKIIFEEFIDIGSHRAPDPPEIYLIDANGNGKEQLITGSSIIGKPECSPDGKKIAFYGPGHELYVGALQGTKIMGISNLTEGYKAYHNRWSPDGTRIVFSDGDKIYTINTDGTNLKEIYKGANYLIAWVPDFPLE